MAVSQNQRMPLQSRPTFEPLEDRRLLSGSAMLVPDALNPALTALVVVGDAGHNLIELRDARGGIEVRVDGQNLGVFSPTGGVMVDGLEGNDRIEIRIDRASLVRGGPGHDDIRTGKGGGIVLGGDGDDKIDTDKSRSIVIGGGGSDDLKGKGGDIVISGTTAHDDDDAALHALLAEWARTDLSVDMRIFHLFAGGGANGSYVLNAADPTSTATVMIDGQANRIHAHKGSWIFFDVALDKTKLGKDVTAQGI